MTGMRSNRPLLSADIHRLVSKVLAVWPGEGPSLACAPMLSDRRCVRFSDASDRCLIRRTL